MKSRLVALAVPTYNLFFACCLVVSMAAGCGTVPQHPETKGAGESAATVAEPADRGGEPTDEEVMYRVFAGEYLGSEGDLERAVEEYLEAALSSDDPAIARRATRVAFAAEAWLQAAMAADRWAILDPTSIAAHEAAATAMLQTGDYMGAEYQIGQILDLANDSIEGWMRAADVLAHASEPDRADALLQQIFVDRPGASAGDVYYARSHLAARSRNTKQAFELARQAVESDPERSEFLTWAGRVALNLDLTDTGLEYIRRAWELDPGNHDLALAYADLLARTGDADGARRVMREMPQTPDVMLSRILFEIAAGDHAAADRLFDSFEDTDFGDAEEQAYYQAQAAEALGYDQRAIELYARVVTGERSVAASIRRAELIAQSGDLERARRELAGLREQTEGLAEEESWLAEARILRQAGDREEAFRVLDEAVRQMPESIPLLYTRALLAAELGWVDIAEHDLRLILAEQPENAAALNALGYTLADQTERLEEAEALIRQAYILQPQEAAIVDSMGWVYYRQGRLAEAEQFLRKAWKLERNPEIAAHLGEVLWMSGKREEAVAIWGEAQSLDAQNAVLMETLERLGIVF